MLKYSLCRCANFTTYQFGNFGLLIYTAICHQHHIAKYLPNLSWLHLHSCKIWNLNTIVWHFLGVNKSQHSLNSNHHNNIKINILFRMTFTLDFPKLQAYLLNLLLIQYTHLIKISDLQTKQTYAYSVAVHMRIHQHSINRATES